MVSLERLKLEISNLVYMLIIATFSKSQPTNDKLSLKGTWSLACDLFNLWKISDNIYINGTR